MLSLYFFFLAGAFAVTLEVSKVGAALYPDWAHDHWVWLSDPQSNQVNVTNMIAGYEARNIPVGAVNIDSGWSTGYNNFVVDTKKFPDMKGLFDLIHSKSIRVILWTTSMVDIDSPNYKEGLAKGYYLNKGATIHWWHGHGSFIDYTNPIAIDWWHKQMDAVLDLGLDGWKTDGTDPFVFELFGAYGEGGDITERQYANAYYRDFFYYTRTKNPNSLIMSRPVDSYAPLGIYWDFSPLDVMYSGWVGDQDPTFDGLQDALRNCFKSAWANYLNFGSDIGGYRGGTRTREVFLRWAQWSTFMPLMENGGDNNHFPWGFSQPQETTAIYKAFVNIHYELKPYFLTAGSTAYEIGISVITPLTEEVIIPDIHGWSYLLWRDIFIAPIVESGLQRKVSFPKGNDWIYWFNTSRVYQGDTELTLDIPMSEFPAFQRKGSVIPLHVSTDDSLHGDAQAKGYLTALIGSPNKGVERTVVRRWNDISTEIWYNYTDTSLSIFATPSPQPLIVLITGVSYCFDTVVDHNNEASLISPIPLLQHKSKKALNEASDGYFCNLEMGHAYVKPSMASMKSGVHIELPGFFLKK